MALTTPFWQYRQTSLFERAKITKDDIKQCVFEWERDAEDIVINGVKFSDILKTPGSLTGEALRGVWRSLLPVSMDKDQQDKCITFFEQALHQGGAPYALRGVIADMAKEKGHTLGAHGVTGTMSFTVKDNTLFIKEEVSIDRILLNSNDKRNMRVLASPTTSHLTTGAAVYAIDLTANTLSIKCTDLVLDHFDETAAKIFDTRSVFEKIVDFLISLVGMNKLVDPIETQSLSL